MNERAIEYLFGLSRLVLQPTVGNENQQGLECDVIFGPYCDKANAKLLTDHSEPHEEQSWKR